MKVLSISGSPRESVGKKDAKQLRKKGFVPCVMYGGEKQVFFYLEEAKLSPILTSVEPITIDIELNGQIHHCIMQDLQFHPVTDKVIHIDFKELSDDKPVTMNVPIQFVGESIGVKRGGKMDVKIKRLPVRAIPSKIPSYIPVDITKLDVGDNIRIRDIINDEYQIIKPPHLMIAKVIYTRATIAGNVETQEQE
jgi:large subunit ribosomal protein L25